MPGQEPRRWRLAEVNLLKSYLLETELDGAIIAFEWRLDDIATRLTQHIVLRGENAPAYVPQAAAALASNLAAGMSRIVTAMESARIAAETSTSGVEFCRALWLFSDPSIANP